MQIVIPNFVCKIAGHRPDLSHVPAFADGDRVVNCKRCGVKLDIALHIGSPVVKGVHPDPPHQGCLGEDPLFKEIEESARLDRIYGNTGLKRATGSQGISGQGISGITGLPKRLLGKK